jgi:hypothetical protein
MQLCEGGEKASRKNCMHMMCVCFYLAAINPQLLARLEIEEEDKHEETQAEESKPSSHHLLSEEVKKHIMNSHRYPSHDSK